MPTLVRELDKLSRAEKLDVLDYLVNSISDGVEIAPDWHQRELHETERRVASGLERPIPWDEAKAILQGVLK